MILVPLIASCLILTFLAGCKPAAHSISAEVVSSDRAVSRLEKYWKLPEFDLVDQDGQPFLGTSMRGRVWVVDFFYSTCAGPCPALTSRLSDIHQNFIQNKKVGFLSVSSDPEKDTPEVLKRYAQKFKADDRWSFLTGSKAAVYSLANQGFKLSLKELTDSPEPISHSTRLCLVDQYGWVRGFYEGVGEGSVESEVRLTQDIETLLR